MGEGAYLTQEVLDMAKNSKNATTPAKTTNPQPTNAAAAAPKTAAPKKK